MLGESFYPTWLPPAPAPALWSLGLCFPGGRLLLLQEGQTWGCAGSCSVVAHHCPPRVSQAKGPSLISRIFPAPPATHPPAHLPPCTHTCCKLTSPMAGAYSEEVSSDATGSCSSPNGKDYTALLFFILIPPTTPVPWPGIPSTYN